MTKPTEQARTTAKKALFLKGYAQFANITHACEQARINRKTFYLWQESDEEFTLQFNQAEMAATERLEKEAWRRAVEGTRQERTTYWHGEPVGVDVKIEYSDALLVLLLKARRPEVYRDKLDVSMTQVIKTIGGVDPASVL